MPICKKCDKKFKNYVKIDGKIRNICKRKYCLECSPFGKHNTIQIHKSSLDEVFICTCQYCGREYQYNRKNRKGHSLKICNSCHANRRKNDLKIKMIEYKGGKCQLCNYSNCNAALEFHHKNPEEKEFTISGYHCYKWEKIKKELDKCILLCSNCHREVECGFKKI